jgi:uncharacterized protein (TIGR02722 family)
MKRIILIALAITMLFILACGPSVKVQRTSPDQTTDLSGRWNDTDASLVAQEMMKDVLNQVWFDEFLKNQQRAPVVIVGTIRNMTSEHIDTGIFINDIERELINSNRVKFVASKLEREEVRDEKLDQQNQSSVETMKKLRMETGADFMLQGSIMTIIDAVDNVTAKYYQTDLQLINLETNEKVWIGTKKIKKIVTRNSLGG